MNRNGENVSDIVMLDAVALSSAIHTRRLSCAEVMTTYLDHIERLNPKVNAIVALEDRGGLISQARERDAQLARGESMGPLHGFPHASACQGHPVYTGISDPERFYPRRR
jgi:Asp-tRNA(Asn)/Glu-tRNA(Gln) amidotransferase A subunit family amidase